jgi:hypothetical protein
MPDIEFIEGEIERMRCQVLRQRNEILQLQRAGIPTTSAEALLGRMLKKSADLRAERNSLKKEQPRRMLGPRWWDDGQKRLPFSRALEKVRRMARRKGWRYQRVRAIIVAIDQYAEQGPATAISFWTSRPVRRALICRDSAYD